MSSLFRKEALEHRKDRLMGDVLLVQPLPLVALSAVCVAIAIGIVALLLWGSFARKEKVQGYLVPDKGVVRIITPNPGTISEVLVEEGQAVLEGDTLVMIKGERALDSNSDVDSVQLEELEKSIKQNTSRIELQNRLNTEGQDRLNQQIKASKQELEEIHKAIKTQSQRLSLAKKRADNAEHLSKSGSLSEIDYQKTLEEYLTLQQQLQDLRRNESTKHSQIASLNSELKELPIKHQSSLAELRNAISDLKYRKAEIQVRKTFALRAPVEGIVTTMQARKGQWQHNQQLMTIIPKDSVLLAELFVPTRAIGFMEKGQAVKVRYSAFPYQRYGIYSGKVVEISQTILINKQDELVVPLDIREPVYRVVVSLEDQTVNAYGRSFSLQAGMSLEADIIINRQTLYEWILDPIYKFKGRF